MEENLIQGFTSYSPAGDNFIKGIVNYREQAEKARILFADFIQNHGFSAFHIHDGWVSHNFNNGNILHHPKIDITWIYEHAGYSHSFRCPKAGEKMVIVENSPDGREGVFDLYCYAVISAGREFLLDSPKLKLELIETKQVLFNKEKNQYQFKPESWISKIWKKIT